ncbi:WD domain, G-beta repeat [Novymonas esmeraldas]|uniref:WD domain, G-beta repeat n=1 Tax=Novymonas esmeraldas TaxID=1808958 RepID=A0AAW0EQ74_9TRYP
MSARRLPASAEPTPPTTSPVSRRRLAGRPTPTRPAEPAAAVPLLVSAADSPVSQPRSSLSSVSQLDLSAGCQRAAEAPALVGSRRTRDDRGKAEGTPVRDRRDGGAVSRADTGDLDTLSRTEETYSSAQTDSTHTPGGLGPHSHRRHRSTHQRDAHSGHSSDGSAGRSGASVARWADTHSLLSTAMHRHSVGWSAHDTPTAKTGDSDASATSSLSSTSGAASPATVPRHRRLRPDRHHHHSSGGGGGSHVAASRGPLTLPQPPSPPSPQELHTPRRTPSRAPPRVSSSHSPVAAVVAVAAPTLSPGPPRSPRRDSSARQRSTHGSAAATTTAAAAALANSGGESSLAEGRVAHLAPAATTQARERGGATREQDGRATGSSRIADGLRRRRLRRLSSERMAPVTALEAAAAAATAALRGSDAPQSRRPVMTWRSRSRVCAVASAPSGELFTGGDPSGVIEVWDSRIGRRLCVLSGHQATVLSLLTLPHSLLLLSGSADCTARLWDMRTLQNTMVLEGHRGLITALATLWMADVGLNLFTGSDDGTVRQWRAATGVCVHVYRGHRGPVNVVTSLRPVKYIATGGSDGLFKVWNAQTLRCLSSIAAVPSSSTSSAALVARESRAARRAGAAGEDGADVRGGVGGGAVWDIAQLSDSDQSLATATDDGVVRLWATHSNQHAVLLKEICIPDMLLKGRSGARCLLACGAILFVGGARGELYVWGTAALPYVCGDAHGAPPRTTSSASTAASAGAGTAVETYRATFLFHTAAVTGLTLQGTQLCSASLDHTMCRWDLRELVHVGDEADGAASVASAALAQVGLGLGAWRHAAGADGVLGDAGARGAPHTLTPHVNARGGATRTSPEDGDAVAELSATETAALYTELPLDFVVRHVRMAATSPVEMGTVLRVAWVVVYVAVLALFFVFGLASVSRHSVDVATGAFASTANRPLPGFARPRTFRSIAKSGDVTWWLRTLMVQLHDYQDPVRMGVSRGSSPEAGASPNATARGSPTTLQRSSSSSSSSNSSSSSRGGGDDSNHNTTAVPVETLELPALPGGAVVLSHVRVRLKRVVQGSCSWNDALPLRRSSSPGTASACFGALRKSTEARDSVCVTHNPSPSPSSSPSPSPPVCLRYLASGAGIPFGGLAGVYDDGGYAVDLPIGLPDAGSAGMQSDLEMLLSHSTGFMDEMCTRLVDVLLYTYHLHSHTFVQLHYALEMPVSGVWLPTTNARAFTAHRGGDRSTGNTRSAGAVVACVVCMAVLQLCCIGLVAYEAVLAYYTGDLLAHVASATMLLDVAVAVSGLCVVGVASRWMAVSDGVRIAPLLRQMSTPSPPPAFVVSPLPEVQAVLGRLAGVEDAFRSLNTATAVHALLLFLQVFMVLSRLVPFLQLMRVAVRRLLLQLLLGLALLALAVTGFALAFYVLFGPTQRSYSSVSSAMLHLLLYLSACLTVSDGVSPQLSTERPIMGRLLILLLNYVVRAAVSAYAVVLLSNSLQSVARAVPAIPPRAVLAKWWSDVRYQLALMGTVGGGGDGEGRGSQQTSTLHPSMRRGTHRTVLVEHLWRRLLLLQQQQQQQQHTRQQASTSHAAETQSCGPRRGSSPTRLGGRRGAQGGGGGGGGDADPFAAAELASTMTFTGSDGADSTVGSSGRRREGRRCRSGSHGATSASLTDGVGAAAGDRSAAAALVDLMQVREMDLLLLVPDESRTPLARSVVRHTWNTLTWMYHYSQQHQRRENPTAQDQRRRLADNIHRVQQRLALLHTVVSATHVRMADHEARLRPLAQAVAAVSTDEQR